MVTPSALIGVLSLGRFGSDAAPFGDTNRRFANDLAARVALAVENASLYEKARGAIELRDRFLTIAAHELKTPLTTLQGYSQLLSLQLAAERRPGAPLGGGYRTTGPDISPACSEQILDVSRLGAARIQLTREDTELVGMVCRASSGFQSPSDSSTEFRLHFAQERVQAEVDRARIAQVMLNLMENAVRYSRPRQPDRHHRRTGTGRCCDALRA